MTDTVKINETHELSQKLVDAIKKSIDRYHDFGEYAVSLEYCIYHDPKVQYRYDNLIEHIVKNYSKQ